MLSVKLKTNRALLLPHAASISSFVTSRSHFYRKKEVTEKKVKFASVFETCVSRPRQVCRLTPC